MTTPVRKRMTVLGLLAVAALPVVAEGTTQPDMLSFNLGFDPIVQARISVLHAPARRTTRSLPSIATMTPAERRAAIDAFWGPGRSAAEELKIFDTFWQYVDTKSAAFQNLDVDWPALRATYRGEVANGVSRGRFAAIMNKLSLALRDSHSFALDLLVNGYTVPEPGVPLMGVSGWIADTSGACLTAQDDGSALVYSAVPNHPLGLVPGDRILGYDGRPWTDLYHELLYQELPIWPVWWGTTPSSFEHTFVMSAGINWHLFDTMDIAKQATGQVVHMPTSLMPGAIFWGFCSEQLDIPGIPKPTFTVDDLVSAGVVPGTRIGYIYSWGWFGDAADEFTEAVYQLTQVEHVEGLIIDFRFNEGGFLDAPFRGLGVLAQHPTATIGMDERRSPFDHFAMQAVFQPAQFTLDFDHSLRRRVIPVKSTYDGPIAVLVGPGAVSAGDFGALWSTYLPRVRTFGKSTAMAVGLPTQQSLGTVIDLGPDWLTRVAETNSCRTDSPKSFLIHTEFPVDELVWLTPADVAVGRDTVVTAAMKWLAAQIGQ